MRRLVILCGTIVLLSACNGAGAPSGAGTGSAAPSSPGASAPAGAVTGDIFASKARYIAFLECAGKKDASAAALAGPMKTAVGVYTDAQWEQLKAIVKTTHKSFIDQYGAGCQ